MRRRLQLHREEGWMLPTAIMLLGAMLAVALASYSFVDTGQERSREQRERETALNVAEGVLYDQGFSLAQQWPGNAAAGAAMPDTCSETFAAPAAGTPRRCPDPGVIAGAPQATFANVDAAETVTYTTRVRDNGGPLASSFEPAAVDASQTGAHVRSGQPYSCPGPCKWDANGDRQLWVQTRSVVRGRPRNVVALLKREAFAESFAHNAIVAGSLSTTNSGNKVIVDATGSQVVTRCVGYAPSCLDYVGADPKDKKEQIRPEPIKQDPAYPKGMDAAQLQRFKIAAQTSDPPGYHTACPTSFEGPIVFIDVTASTACTDVSGAIYNSPSSPGIVIMPRGRLADIKATHHSILYLGNEQNSSGTLLSFGANAEILGGISIDGPGHLQLGQASGPRPTVTYRETAFNLMTFGTTGLVQNTWRELPPN